MNQLDKLKILDSNWKAFKLCTNSDTVEKAKTILLYAVSRGIDVASVIALDKSILLKYGRSDHNKKCMIAIKENALCDIYFINENYEKYAATYRTLIDTEFFGISEIMIEMYLCEKEENVN